ncbi:MAG: hypothetical protein IPP94_18155 [Ignavibacteria bacterium]|nr:hypothetical protein [Ignavibacteria bacterium]
MSRSAVTLSCPVCGSATDALLPTCGSCGAFVQDRVPAINLFETAFGLVDDPAAAFRRIARSEQKNYVFTLFAGCGPLLVALGCVAAATGNAHVHFGLVLGAIVVGGPPAGLLLMTPAAWVAGRLNAALWKLRLPFRSTAALLAYGVFPVVLASCIILPIQVALFGADLFSAQPAPWTLKPVAFWTLAGMDALLLLWSGWLLTRGFLTYGLDAKKSLLTVTPVFAALAALVYAAGSIARGFLP